MNHSIIHFGKTNFLKILRKTGRGTFLAGGNLGELFLPKGQTPDYCEVGDKIEVFVYQNSDSEAVATTKKARVSVGEVACLRVVSVNSIGAFLDWGLPKDLFAPFGQQATPMKLDEWHIVAVYQDNTGRIAASSKLNRFVKAETNRLKNGQKVKVIVGARTDLGYKMIINSKFWGVLHHSDAFQTLKYGKSITAYIKKRRSDGRIDLSLTEPVTSQQKTSLQQKILDRIQQNDGFCYINDKTSPEIIYQTFSVSKKVFKAALGNLYKQGKILIEKDGIRTNQNAS